MKYMGSKTKIAKDIVPIINAIIHENNYKTYIEPFVGGANVIDKIICQERIGYDLNPYLIGLLKYVRDDGVLLDEVPRELYNKVRKNYKSGIYEDWYVGNIGFLASSLGRFFDGGYAKPSCEKGKIRNYYQEAKRNLSKQAPDLKGIKFYKENYSNLNPCNCMIYCDPPYAEKKQYSVSKNFDYNKFWDTMRRWSKDNYVLVSELNAPDDFICVWERPTRRTIKVKDKSIIATEKLFIWEDL